MERKIRSKPIVQACLSTKPYSYYQLRHIKYASKIHPVQNLSKNYESVKSITSAEISFKEDMDKHLVMAHNFKEFSNRMHDILTTKSLRKIHVGDNSVFENKDLRKMILKSTRITSLTVCIDSHENSILPYLKQVQNLNLIFNKPIDEIIHQNHSIDTLGLQKLKHLRKLKIIIPNDNYDLHGGNILKLQPKNIAHLLTIFSDKKFKAEISISSPELITKDKILCVTPNFKGATHITSLDLGHVDADSLAFIIRDYEAFTHLKHLSLQLKISKKNEADYLPLLPFFAAMRGLKSLNILFMLPFFNFDSQDIFLNLKLPADLTSLGLDIYPMGFCQIHELQDSHYNCFNKQLERLTQLENLSLRLIVSSNMHTCYKWIASFSQSASLQSLKNLNLQLGYHINPKSTEFVLISDLLKWTSSLSGLERLKLLLDFPNFAGLESYVSTKDHPSMKNLKRFIFKIPDDKTLDDDGFSAEVLGYLLKTLEGSYDKLELLDIGISSLNFNEECFGVLLNIISRMNKLKQFNCNVHEGKFGESIFHAFEEGVKSIDTLDEVNVTTDVNIKGVEAERENGHATRQNSMGETVREKIANILNWGV